MNGAVPSNQFFVVGIGASAGGVQALASFFANLPERPDAAFVVVQHLSPDFKSMMTEILQRQTSLMACQIEDGMRVEPNMVYVLPPGKNVVLQDGKLHLLNRPGHLNYPINLFFESLAKEYSDRAIGVVLSGGGSDGTDGLQSVSRAGGVALVQSPETAQFGSMPINAISLGLVDQILSPKELAEAVYHIVQFKTGQLDSSGGETAAMVQTQLQKIVGLLSEQENTDFSAYKVNTLKRRILHRCALTRSRTVEDYLQILSSSAEERKLLRQSLLIGATRFFRDKQPWKILETEVLPQLIEQISDGQQLRIWVSACATGEEAYSLAMIVDEVIAKTDKNVQVKLFVTDIDTQALAIAAKGIYPETISVDISAERLAKYFEPKTGHYQVKRFLREMLIISPHDLTKNPGFSRMHLVTCRNVLIYMQPQLQDQVLRLLHFTLMDSGTLFLGSSENLGQFSEEFATLSSKWKIYRKLDTGHRFLPVTSAQPALSIVQPARQLQGRRAQTARFEQQVTELLKYCFDNRRATCLMVDPNNELVRVFYNSAQLLTIDIGEARLEVTELVPPDLKLPLETSLHRARREGKTVLYNDIRIQQAEHTQSVNLKIGYDADSVEENLIVIMELAAAPASVTQAPVYEIESEITEHVTALERELQQTRENLQVTIEELETTNEEQQATNEELLASNEELQSTNEELQSVNEELYTVNIEHQNKIRELTRLNEDVDNLLHSTEIGVVFLDRELNIRKFTPVVSEVINIRPVDVDRPISHFTHTLAETNLKAFAQQILTTEAAAEQEVKNTRNGDQLLMRGNPYFREDGSQDGVVLSFIKINELKAMQAELQETNSILENIYAASPLGFALLDKNLRYLRINQTLANINGISPSEHLGKTPAEILPGELGQTAHQLHQQVLKTGQAIHNREICSTLLGDQLRFWTASYFPVALHNGQPGVAAVIAEVTELKQTQRALEESQNFIRRISESTPGIIYIYDLESNRNIYLNATVQAILGYTAAEVMQMENVVSELVHPEDINAVYRYFQRFAQL
ncbi:MAG: PAS domain S-box protein [Leptolyngbya sp. SIO4C1]|nr:PAS domain S-box protein [Leptolyngbya sp. SIO4C1]